MELNGERTIPASIDATWAALNDPATLKACIAGCETLERVGDDGFVAVVAMKIGPVSARFKGNLKLTNVQAPTGYTINFDGQGGVAGFGKGSADVSLSPVAASTQPIVPAGSRSRGKGGNAPVGASAAPAGARACSCASKALKKSSVILAAVASIRREPICAILPPTVARAA